MDGSDIAYRQIGAAHGTPWMKAVPCVSGPGSGESTHNLGAGSSVIGTTSEAAHWGGSRCEQHASSNSGKSAEESFHLLCPFRYARREFSIYPDLAASVDYTKVSDWKPRSA